MILRLFLFLGLLMIVSACGLSNSEDYSLDPAIPRVETPEEEIASVRTRWFNDRHTETAFLDDRNRVLESFNFGRSSGKTLNYHKGLNDTLTVSYYHSDSSPRGYVQIDSVRRKFDAEGRLIFESNVVKGVHDGRRDSSVDYHRKRYLGYTVTGDTIVKKIETSYEPPDSSRRIDVDRWEGDEHHRPARHYKLLVFKQSRGNDTINYYSRRFVYDSSGKLAMAWFDYMYLRQFYMPEGPDTVRYYYDSQDRLAEERHRYTTNMSNKGEPSEVGLSEPLRKSRAQTRGLFLKGSVYRPSNRTDTVRYKYEAFDPKKHFPLKIPLTG